MRLRVGVGISVLAFVTGLWIGSLIYKDVRVKKVVINDCSSRVIQKI